mmetsp:Transcript_24629/g.53554  ORF Transcript_24629/g.53554 Transcript_24629/m.53554 type:complete len:173 (-) Transcript_24629:246-764(-)
MKQCYCEATYSLAGTETTNPAAFSVTNTDMDGDPNEWCNSVLSGDSWPNFLAFNGDESKYAYCGFRAFKDNIDIEGTSDGLGSSTCAVDAVLDPDFQCVTTISKAGFSCVQVSDGRVFAGSKSNLVSQREECSSLTTGQQVAFIILGVILIVFSLVWVGCWSASAFKSMGKE